MLSPHLSSRCRRDSAATESVYLFEKDCSCSGLELDIVRFTGDDSWKDTREEKNAGKCAAFGEEGEKSTLSAWILNYRHVRNRP
ncbi:hypothetical protein Y032_0137g2027 [Ancylostoma ceylanicum]|uniref:Uncharacterized protein n=1 Tax=Ancylostoma ceylanicum TaxID=53326 RepID=A0A016T4Z2_9BILA|nr:hypothetical protein Y032_0137g2027 [Ancylostoma ceylanicum]